MAVPDEYLAFNGTTVLGQIDNLKREEVEKERERERERKESVLKTMSYNKKVQSTTSARQYKMVPSHHHHSGTAAWHGSQSVPVSRGASPPPTSSSSTMLPNIPLGKGGWIEKGGWGEKKGRLGKRKSFFNIFGGRREGGGGAV